MKLVIAVFLCLISSGIDAQEFHGTVSGVEARIQSLQKILEVHDQTILQNHVNDMPQVLMRKAETLIDLSRQYQLLLFSEKYKSSRDIHTIELRILDLKKEAVSVYSRIIIDYPNENMRDMAYFYKGHALRELGDSKAMITCFLSLISDYPESNYIDDAKMILADYYFEQQDIVKYEKYLQEIVNHPKSLLINEAKYKIALLRVKQEKYEESIKLFEQICFDSNQNDKICANSIESLVFAYAQVRNIDDAIGYFKKICKQSSLYVFSLEKLENRYISRDLKDKTLAILREYIRVSSDMHKKLEYAFMVYEITKKNNDKKYNDMFNDTQNIVSLISYFSIYEKENKNAIDNLELILRDSITQLHAYAKNSQKQDVYTDIAKLYQSYLIYFQGYEFWPNMRNNAIGLFELAHWYIQANDLSQERLKLIQNKQSDEYKILLYNIVHNYYMGTFASEEYQKNTSMYQFIEFGQQYLAIFPKDVESPTILFQIGKSFYDLGLYDKAIESFLIFYEQNKTHKNVKIALEAIIDCYEKKQNMNALIVLCERILTENPIKEEAFKNKIQFFLKNAKRKKFDLDSKDKNSDEYVIFAQKEYEKNAKTPEGEEILIKSFQRFQNENNLVSMKLFFDLYFANYEKSEKMPEILLAMNLEFLDGFQIKELFQWVTYFLNKYSSDARTFDLVQQAANLFATTLSVEEAEKMLQFLIQKGTREHRLWAHQKRVFMYRVQKNEPMIVKSIADALEDYKNWPSMLWALYTLNKLDTTSQNNKILEQMATGIPLEQQDVYAIAFARIQLFEKERQAFMLLKIKDNKNVQEVLQEKLKRLNDLETYYLPIAQSNASLYQAQAQAILGAAYVNMKNFFTSIPIPQDMSDNNKKEMLNQLLENAKINQQKSQEMFKKCASFTDVNLYPFQWLKACKEQKEDLNIAFIFADIHENISNTSTEPKSLFQKLKNDLNDEDILQEMYQIYAKQKQFHWAYAVAQRIQTLDDSSYTYFESQGILWGILHEDLLAIEAFKQAQKMGSHHAKMYLESMYVHVDEK